ncbi:MAG: 4-(cytidine 5'-diphospho)-2-C-methyl-D-erythritol kinase [Rikenellaceae bacterium]|nr:4-(cytidine 5'-diphospho)-2-C-methyl-D-erythritol kinase [Rikenellaceae bacterium]
MILFPNAKINLGLRVTAKRPDGYHDIETAMVPVPGLCDALEILRDEGDGCTFSTSGIAIDAPAGKNLCVRAYDLMHSRYGIGGVKMHLHKNVPFAAGLGGGSADAVFALKMLGELFTLNISEDELEALAAELGSDTPFFVRNRPMIATGRGEKLTPCDIDLSAYRVVIVKPPVGVSTAQAYARIVPAHPIQPLATLLAEDIGRWRESVHNDFEPVVFATCPELATIKERLYACGARYAAMSGSGSAIFGLFDHLPDELRFPADYFVYTGNML